MIKCYLKMLVKRVPVLMFLTSLGHYRALILAASIFVAPSVSFSISYCSLALGVQTEDVLHVLKTPVSADAAISRSLTAPQIASLPVAKEIELYRTTQVNHLIMPEGNLLINAIPLSRRAAYKAEFFPKLSEQEFSKLEWNRVSNGAQDGAFIQIGPTVNFAQDRSVPGFTAREFITIKPDNNFTFLGRDYKKDELAVVDLRGFLHSTVEYATGEVVARGSDLELHFRGKSPGQLDNEVRIFFETVITSIVNPEGFRSIGQKLHSDHVHVVAQKPKFYISRLREQGVTDPGIAAALTGYHALAELSFIFRMLRNGYNIGEFRSRPNSPPYFSFLQRDKLPDFLKFYDSIVEGRNLTLDKYGDEGTSLKKNFIGARWGSTYSDVSLWGLEVRFPSYRNSHSFADIADSIKVTLDTQNFPFSLNQIKRFEALRKDQKLFSRLWPSLHEPANASEFADPELRALAQQITKSPTWQTMRDTAMLAQYFPGRIFALYDWSSHPFFSEKPELVQRIKNQQLAIFSAILEKQQNPQKYVHMGDEMSFFKESGIEGEVNRLMNLQNP